MAEVDLPESLSINAWTGADVMPSRLAPDAAKRWTISRAFAAYSPTLAAADLNLRDWKNPCVGWGIVLPDNDAFSESDRATAIDAPKAIQNLVNVRPNAVVLRYREDIAKSGFIRRYYVDRAPQDLAISGGARGTAEQCIPYYLLVFGGPDRIPWWFQYRLNLDCFVGRLDLEGLALERYVNALINDWACSQVKREAPTIWSTDHAPNDITHLMHFAIAKCLEEKFRGDDEARAGLRALYAAGATLANLRETLSESKPALIITTSHGMTGPLSNPEQMKSQLGWLVDQDHKAIDPADLLSDWQPGGAVWYAHACCSAGGNGKSVFKDLVPSTSDVARILDGVAELGPVVAGNPRALLGAEKPLRAFIGHVEPTFDWTLQAQTNQLLTQVLVDSLYNRLYNGDPYPVGYAFKECYRLVGSLMAQWDVQVAEIDKAAKPEARARMRAHALRTKLTALDRQSMVILGDPTVTLPKPGS